MELYVDDNITRLDITVEITYTEIISITTQLYIYFLPMDFAINRKKISIEIHRRIIVKPMIGYTIILFSYTWHWRDCIGIEQH